MVGRIQELVDGGAKPKGGSANLLFGQIFTEHCINVTEMDHKVLSLIYPVVNFFFFFFMVMINNCQPLVYTLHLFQL